MSQAHSQEWTYPRRTRKVVGIEKRQTIELDGMSPNVLVCFVHRWCLTVFIPIFSPFSSQIHIVRGTPMINSLVDIQYWGSWYEFHSHIGLLGKKNCQLSLYIDLVYIQLTISSITRPVISCL